MPSIALVKGILVPDLVPLRELIATDQDTDLDLVPVGAVPSAQVLGLMMIGVALLHHQNEDTSWLMTMLCPCMRVACTICLWVMTSMPKKMIPQSEAIPQVLLHHV